ncbi:ER membrane protein complex subunit 5 [[Candida] zeylanoides]
MSRLAYILGCAILAHAGYSSFEFHQLLKATHHNAAPPAGLASILLGSSNSLPSDIVLETLIGVVVLVYGAISSIQTPAFLNLEDKVIEPTFKYLKPIEMKTATLEFEQLKINPFASLETRVEFIDIVKKRQEYRDWSSDQVVAEQ